MTRRYWGLLIIAVVCILVYWAFVWAHALQIDIILYPLLATWLETKTYGVSSAPIIGLCGNGYVVVGRLPEKLCPEARRSRSSTFAKSIPPSVSVCSGEANPLSLSKIYRWMFQRYACDEVIMIGVDGTSGRDILPFRSQRSCQVDHPFCYRPLDDINKRRYPIRAGSTYRHCIAERRALGRAILQTG